MKPTMMLMALMCVAMAASLTAAEPTFSYPKCPTSGDTSKCCTLSSTAKMAHHGYFLAKLNDKETVVTCKDTKIECHLGNPSLRATSENYGDVTCPDFATLFESRSSIEILEGVLDTPSTSTDSDATLGQVKAASS